MLRIRLTAKRNEMIAFLMLTGTAFLGSAQTEGDLRSLEGKTVQLKITMPASQEGVDLWPTHKPPLNYGELDKRVKRFGVAIKEGQTSRITSIRVKSKDIEFQLDGGGVGRRVPGMFGCVPFDLTQRQSDLETKKAAASSAEAERIDAELARVNKEIGTKRAECDQKAREIRGQSGSRFTIHYDAKLTPTEMTVQSLRGALAEYIDFDPPPPGGPVINTGDVQARLEAAKAGVVKIIATKSGNETDTGSGLVVGVDGETALILTAHHVVDNATKIEVTFFAKQYEIYPAHAFRQFNDDLDVAVIIVEPDGGRKLPPVVRKYAIRDVGTIRVGEKLYPVGHPQNLDWQIAQSVAVERVSDPNDVRKVLFTLTGIERGYSGGPLLDQSAAFVGMVTNKGPLYATGVKADSVIGVLREWRIPISQLTQPSR